MTQPAPGPSHRPDEDPIAATGQFQRFVAEEPLDTAATQASRNRIILLSVLAVLVIAAVVVLIIVL